MKKIAKYIFIIFLFSGCDFTSGVQKDILKAQEHLQKKEYKKAAESYQNILQKKPSKELLLKINFQLGDIYSRYLNDYESSIDAYNNIINNSNEILWQIRTLESKAELYFNNIKDYEKSEVIFRTLTKFIPKLEKHNYYRLKLAQSLFHLKKYNESKKILLKLTRFSENKINLLAYYQLGYIEFLNENWNKAIEYWFENLKLETNSERKVRIKFLIGNAYESSEQLKQAYNIYYSIIGQYPNYEVIKSRLDSLYKRRVAKKR